MKFRIWPVVALAVSLATITPQTGHADDLFAGDCIVDPTTAGPKKRSSLSHGEFIILATFGSGLRCDTVLGTIEAADHIKMALLPATLLLANPAVNAQLLAGAEASGIAIGSATVLSVTVFAGITFVTMYYLLKPRYEECVEQKNLLKLRSQIEKMHGVPVLGPIRTDGGR